MSSQSFFEGQDLDVQFHQSVNIYIYKYDIKCVIVIDVIDGVYPQLIPTYPQLIPNLWCLLYHRVGQAPGHSSPNRRSAAPLLALADVFF